MLSDGSPFPEGRVNLSRGTWAPTRGTGPPFPREGGAFPEGRNTLVPPPFPEGRGRPSRGSGDPRPSDARPFHEGRGPPFPRVGSPSPEGWVKGDAPGGAPPPIKRVTLPAGLSLPPLQGGSARRGAPHPPERSSHHSEKGSPSFGRGASIIRKMIPHPSEEVGAVLIQF